MICFWTPTFGNIYMVSIWHVISLFSGPSMQGKKQKCLWFISNTKDNQLGHQYISIITVSHLQRPYKPYSESQILCLGNQKTPSKNASMVNPFPYLATQMATGLMIEMRENLEVQGQTCIDLKNLPSIRCSPITLEKLTQVFTWFPTYSWSNFDYLQYRVVYTTKSEQKTLMESTSNAWLQNLLSETSFGS